MPLKFSQIMMITKPDKRAKTHGIEVDLLGRTIGFRCRCGNFFWPEPSLAKFHKGRCSCGEWVCPLMKFVNPRIV
jgi:hypothetical protein